MSAQSSNYRTLRLGTRLSKLARWQADWVSRELRANEHRIELVLISTTGDVTSGPIDESGSVGLFTREIQRAPLDDEIDMAVHSLKDLPTATPAGLTLAAVPLRGSALDVLVSREGNSLDELPPRSRVGTGSNRRKSQLLHYRSDLDIIAIRGNVDTRLRKLDEGDYDAIVLAEAGLTRLGCEDRITQRVPIEICLPAPAQGALGVEIRSGDDYAMRAAWAINDAKHEAETTAERAFLAAVEAGCSSPAAACCRCDDNEMLQLDVAVLDLAGTRKIAAAFSGDAAQARVLGERAAKWALDNGAHELL